MILLHLFKNFRACLQYCLAEHFKRVNLFVETSFVAALVMTNNPSIFKKEQTTDFFCRLKIKSVLILVNFNSFDSTFP